MGDQRNCGAALPFYNHKSMPGAQLEKVFLPPGSGFLRRNFVILMMNFPNMEEDFPNILGFFLLLSGCAFRKGIS